MISQLIVKSNIFDKINDYVITDVTARRGDKNRLVAVVLFTTFGRRDAETAVCNMVPPR